MNTTITLLQHRLRQRGGSLAQISTAAVIMCEIIDEKEELWCHDRNRYNERIKALEAKVAKLDKASHSE